MLVLVWWSRWWLGDAQIIGFAGSLNLPSLLISVNNADERHMPIVGESTLVGRDPENQIVVDHPTVSRRHVEISSSEAGWFVKDLGSRNGTTLNGEKLDSTPKKLSHGSEIRLGGDRVIASFLSENETISSSPAFKVRTLSWIPRGKSGSGSESDAVEKVFGVLRLTPWLRFAGSILGLTAAILSLIWWFTRIF